MPDYQLFGAIFRSDLELPELVPYAARRARWWLSRATESIDPGDLQLLGAENVEPGIRARFYSSRVGFRLVFDDTGVFDFSRDGHRILWTAPESANLDAARKDILGRVAAVCLELDGMSVLHGSAVHVGAEAIVFLAPKFHGKSTTAAALVDRGGRLLADDLVAVTSDTIPRIAPAIPVVQLWQDSATHVAQRAASARGDGSSVKVQRGWDDLHPDAFLPVPFGAAYLLSPFAADTSRAVRRERLAPVAAALALLGQAKIGCLLGPAWRARMLARLTEIATVVPVYRLETPRDYGRLGELTETLWTWHTATSADGAVHA